MKVAFDEDCSMAEQGRFVDSAKEGRLTTDGGRWSIVFKGRCCRRQCRGRSKDITVLTVGFTVKGGVVSVEFSRVGVWRK